LSRSANSISDAHFCDRQSLNIFGELFAPPRVLSPGQLLPTMPATTASYTTKKVKVASPYSITERRVQELIPVLDSQPAGDVSHKPGGRLPLLSARPAVNPQPLRRRLPISLLGEQRHDGCEQFA